MKKVFIDTNVLIDVVEQRKPFFLYCANILELAVANRIEVYATALTFVNTIHIARKSLGTDTVIGKLEALRRYIHISPMTEKEMNNAFNLPCKDMEDSLQYCSAISAGCNILVTRNTKDFPKSDICDILTPQEFLNTL